MRDFEIAAIVLIAWVLLYSTSYSRASNRHEVTSINDKWKFSFKNSQEISWEMITFKDENYGYEVYQDGPFYQHEFLVKHAYGNEFKFRKSGDDFEVTDKYGKRCRLKLEGSDYVILTWPGSEGSKNYYQVR